MADQLRHSAKVLLLDGRGRTLLFCGVDPGDRSKGRFWFPPGGGIEAGETPQQAAVREVREEVGLLLTPEQLSPEVIQREASFTHEGTAYRQREHYFAAWVEEAVDPATGGWTPVERRSIQEHRWWTLDELRRSAEPVFPENLITILADLHRPGERPSLDRLSGPRVLHHRDPDRARDLVALQQVAYRVEAELIGSDAIPPLEETPDEIMALDLHFLAFMDGDVPVAAVGYRLSGDVLDVDRLMVDPRLFRRGLARRLLTETLATVPHHRAVVSTGTANTPARRLYLDLGFRHVADHEAAPGLLVSRYERVPQL